MPIVPGYIAFSFAFSFLLPYLCSVLMMVMKAAFRYRLVVFCMLSFLFFTPDCKKDHEEPKPSDVWDIDTEGYPKFINTNYIELDKIYQISKFRSSVGHDYSDAFEDCRSMKHYFQPKENTDWATIRIFSPVTGKITRAETEWAGLKLEVEAKDYPAFRFQIFHITPALIFNIGDEVVEGQQLGTHVGTQTMSDISVIVNDPTRQGRMISYFNLITDDVFNEYSQLGISSINELIISKELRDANPLICDGDAFISVDTLENWVILE